MSSINRVIPLTGTGVSALATVRLVGPLVPTFLRDHFSKPLQAGRIMHGEMRDEAGILDDPVVAIASDSSYADITLHGGVWVVESFIACACRAGFLLPKPDDDPRLFFPESDDILQAELNVALPMARTELAARLLLVQPKAWSEWRASSPDSSAINAMLADESLHHLLHPPTVAIIGLPNAGKSTLANHLFGTQRSIVSPVAGTTRDWVGEEANLDGLIVKLLDTPGLHETGDPIERQAIAQSKLPVEQASLVLVLLDATRTLDEQRHLLDATANPLLAMNKIDLNPRVALDATADGVDVIGIDARAGNGLDRLIRSVHARFHINNRPLSAARWWTARQREMLGRAVLSTGTPGER